MAVITRRLRVSVIKKTQVVWDKSVVFGGTVNDAGEVHRFANDSLQHHWDGFIKKYKTAIKAVIITNVHDLKVLCIIYRDCVFDFLYNVFRETIWSQELKSRIAGAF